MTLILVILKWYLIIGILIGFLEAVLLIIKETPFKEVATNTFATILVWPAVFYHGWVYYQEFQKRRTKK